MLLNRDSKNQGYPYRVRKLFTHPSYLEKKHHKFDYDVGIIELKKSIDYREYRAIALPVARLELCDDTYMTLTGYQGDENDQGLRMVHVPKVSEASCYNSYFSLGGITPRMFCAGRQGTDTCRGIDFYFFYL